VKTIDEVLARSREDDFLLNKAKKIKFEGKERTQEE
tara:strand:- start:318 stop:425 length:108 start_codon:yes stop_codon:yes gene_type:complete